MKSIRAKKSLGQNFLMHARIADRIAMESGVGKGDTVVEIGPGTGMLTRALLARAGTVIAIEADGELISPLTEQFAREIADGKLELMHADIRTFDIAPALQARDYKLVANIPYYLTGEIIRDFLSAAHKPSSMTLLVQKEVAERIARDPKGSILSIAVRAYGTPAYAFTVPRGAFRPAPAVDSAALLVTDIRDPFGSREEEAAFFAVLRAGFAHKRKRLKKNLEAIAAPEAVRAAFSDLLLGENARAEDLSLPHWRQLAGALSESR